MNKKIRTGIIGVSAERGWASVAHIPAIQAIPAFELTAVSNRNKDAALAAAKAFGVPNAYDNTNDLVNSKEVDVVVVTVKVPLHKELVSAAVNAGKDVFCEWPLGNGLQEAEALANLVKEKGVRGIIGLQSRAVPAINYIKDLVAQGYVGEVLSTTLVGSGIFYGATIDKVNAYALDAKNGAGMLYSTFGNTIDALCYSLGEFESLNATALNRRKEATIVETGDVIPMTTYDQIVVNGVLENGAVAVVHFRGGMSKGTNFLWEINGTKGDLFITAGGGHPGVFELSIKGSNEAHKELETLEVPDSYFKFDRDKVKGPAYNIGESYLRLASDFNNGTHLAPTFDDALIRHKMLHAIEVAASTGTSQRYIN